MSPLFSISVAFAHTTSILFRFTNSGERDVAGRQKPGYDFYKHILGIQLLQFFCVMLFMQRFEALSSSLQENSVSGDFVKTLFWHFILIVADRCIYLLKSIRGKYGLQVITVGWVFGIMHSGMLYKDSLSSGLPLFIWYMMECLYLFFSALQVSYGYPPFVGGFEVSKKKTRWYHGTLFSIYRAIPFLYEISLILDWACTETTLMVGDWIKLEDINSTLFLVDANLDFLRTENRSKGQPQPIHRKWLTGALVFVLLCFIVWFPLFVFSTGTVGNNNNPVTQIGMSVGLKKFPDLYRVEYEKEKTPLLDESYWYALERRYDNVLPALGEQERAEYRNELQEITMLPSSGEVWSITDPAKESLISSLAKGEKTVLTVNYRFLMGSTGTEEYAVSEKVLTDEEVVGFGRVLTGNMTAFVVEKFIPKFFRIASGGGVVKFLDGTWPDLASDCIFSMGNSSMNSQGWWNMVCGDNEEECTKEFLRNGNASDICDGPKFFTVSAKTTFGTYLEGYSVLGLYLLVVGSVAGFVRASFVNTQVNIWQQDLPRVEVLRETLSHLYQARMHGDLVLEEELYREIIDLYRQPEKVFRRTGLYKHWFQDSDDSGRSGSSGEEEGGEGGELRRRKKHKKKKKRARNKFKAKTGKELLEKEMSKYAE